MTAEHPNVARVRAHAQACGVALRVRRFAGTTRTASDAAREIGCSVAEIVKSLTFVASHAEGRSQTVVALVSGDDRIDEARLREALGAASVRRATAIETKATTGFAIGGVPPFGHAAARVVVDRRLRRFGTVWAAAGLADAAFPISPDELVRLSGATPAEIAAVPDLGALQALAAVEGRECVVGALIVDEHGRVFVHRRSPDRRFLPGCWDVVGGHVEPGESLLDALARETREETGWCLRGLPRLVHTVDWETEEDGRARRRREFDFLVDVEGDLERPRLERPRHVAFRWVAAGETALLDENRGADNGLVRQLVELALRMRALAL